MVSPDRSDYRRLQAETPLIVLFKFAEPALWFANPLMLAAVLLRKHKRAATILASLAIFLATSVTSITFNTVPAKVSHLVVIRFGLGYYLWLASSISLLVVMRLSFRTISGVSGSPEGAESK
jgi:hypothetical protein